MVRPEHLVLGRADGEANELRATIREVVYLGSYIRYLAELASGDGVTVEEQNRPGGARGAVGESVTLRVAPEHCLLLDRAERAPAADAAPSDQGSQSAIVRTAGGAG